MTQARNGLARGVAEARSLPRRFGGVAEARWMRGGGMAKGTPYRGETEAWRVQAETRPWSRRCKARTGYTRRGRCEVEVEAEARAMGGEAKGRRSCGGGEPEASAKRGRGDAVARPRGC